MRSGFDVGNGVNERIMKCPHCDKKIHDWAFKEIGDRIRELQEEYERLKRVIDN